jgi:phosphoribosylanthranilate isomerase
MIEMTGYSYQMPLRTRIKLCGLRSFSEVETAVNSGADALGFVFYEQSPRAVTIEAVTPWVNTLPAWVTPVALFVNPRADQVWQAVRAMPGLTLQFHADESPEFCEQFGVPYIKVARIRSELNLADFCLQYSNAAAILVDQFVSSFGGAGEVFDWSILPSLSQLSKPLILSGGLTLENIVQAIQTVQPYGVDVSSGIEFSRGQKCLQKMKAFCKAVQMVDAGK